MEQNRKNNSDLKNNVSRELFMDMDTDQAPTEQMMHFGEEKETDDEEEPIDNSQE